MDWIDPSNDGHAAVKCDDGAILSQVMLKGAAAGDVVMWEVSAALISGEACHSKEACHSRGGTPMFFVVQIDGISVCGPEYPPAFNTQATRYEWQFNVPQRLRRISFKWAENVNPSIFGFARAGSALKNSILRVESREAYVEGSL